MQLKKRVIGAVGRIEEYAAAIPPRNTIKANGAELSRVLFWRLFKYAQESGNLVNQGIKDRGQYGTGDGLTTFTIPDRRGVIGRGFDDGAGLDSAPTLGRYQADENKAHIHVISPDGLHNHAIEDIGGNGSYVDGVGSVDWNAGPNQTQRFTRESGVHDHAMSHQGEIENTVKNISLLYCIRYQ